MMRLFTCQRRHTWYDRDTKMHGAAFLHQRAAFRATYSHFAFSWSILFRIDDGLFDCIAVNTPLKVTNFWR